MFNITKLLAMLIILSMFFTVCGCAKNDRHTQYLSSSIGSEIDNITKLDVDDKTKNFASVDISMLDENAVIEVNSSPSFMTRFRTYEEIIEKSDYIVSGCAEKVYYTTIGELSYTVVDFLVEDSLKGDIKANSLITVLFFGGYISVEENIKLKDNAEKFASIPEEKRATTFIKRTVSGAPLPTEKECYVLCLGENENYKGTYYPRNEFETIFKKTGEVYERYLPNGYFEEKKIAGHTDFVNQKSFKLTDFKSKIKQIEEVRTD